MDSDTKEILKSIEDRLSKRDDTIDKLIEDVGYIKGKVDGRNNKTSDIVSKIGLGVSVLTFVLGAMYIIYRISNGG